MKTKINLLACLSLLLSVQLPAQSSKLVSKSESVEWSHSNIVTGADGQALPSVLLIGDSHVERYYPVVSGMLKDCYVSKITTAKSLGDPDYIAQLKGLLANYRFDVIFFNNGLHGVKYTIDEYARDLPVIYRILRKNNPNVKIYWVETTARRINGDIDHFDQYNEGVNDRNKRVHAFTKKNNIPVLGFSELSLDHKEYYTKDGIHFNENGVKVQAQMIVDEVMKCLKNDSH